MIVTIMTAFISQSKKAEAQYSFGKGLFFTLSNSGSTTESIKINNDAGSTDTVFLKQVQFTLTNVWWAVPNQGYDSISTVVNDTTLSASLRATVSNWLIFITVSFTTPMIIPPGAGDMSLCHFTVYMGGVAQSIVLNPVYFEGSPRSSFIYTKTRTGVLTLNTDWYRYKTF